MREYLFRGRTTNGYWVYGSLIHVENYCCILDHEAQDGYDAAYLDSQIGWIDGCATPVDPETVGQYTGLEDKNGTSIFEGDIVRTKHGRMCIVVWFANQGYNGWDLQTITTYENCQRRYPDQYDLYLSENLEVVGNIHDNPELLEEP